MLNEMQPYILKGKMEEDFSSVSLTVNWIGFLDRYKHVRDKNTIKRRQLATR